MSGFMESYEKRRSDLSARAEADRNALAAAFADVQEELHVAEKVVAIAQRVARHKWIFGVAAAGMVVAPLVARKWIRRAAAWLPIALAGYRVVRKARSRTD